MRMRMTDYQNNFEFLDLFDHTGHLTDQAFQGLMDERLSPMQSLEVSEHLSFCDSCISRYTERLCGVSEEGSAPDHLISPPEPLAPGVMQQLQRKATILYFNKLASLLVAASFALVFWATGLFTPDLSNRPCEIIDTIHSSTHRINEETGKIADTFLDHWNHLFLRWPREETPGRP